MIEKVSFEMNNLVYIEKKATTDQLVEVTMVRQAGPWTKASRNKIQRSHKGYK